MSGDVFGNGMLLSEHIRLVAAFDHRHVFLDPTPDAAASFAERRRLFDLPRSSWDDYDQSLISAGGGVFPRHLKSIPVTPEMAEALGIKGSDDDDPGRADPRDPARPGRPALERRHRHLRQGLHRGPPLDRRPRQRRHPGRRQASCAVKVVGEGGNLGLSQLGRIEAALCGVRVNTDAIDNSAGVDTSDHEVNIKILLDEVVRAGQLTTEQRNELLASMTDDVAEHVLRDNYEQNVLLGNARAQEHSMVSVHERLIHWLEGRGDLDRGARVPARPTPRSRSGRTTAWA